MRDGFTRNTGNIHNGGSISLRDLSAFAEQGQKSCTHEELRRDVRLECLAPVLVLALQQVLRDGVGGGEVGLGVGIFGVIIARDAGLGKER